MNFQIWTDGGFSFNNKIGSWSFLLYHDNKDQRIEQYGLVEHHKQTSQIAEMMAIVKALQFVSDVLCEDDLVKAKAVDITITTDSMYCVNSMNDWMHKWQRAGWPADKQNLDLWMQVYALKLRFKTVNAVWVKGHSGVELNERVDYLNQQALIEKGLR
jgi:ribonuclease HI